MGHLQVASNHYVSLVAETGVRKKSVSMQKLKLKLRELNAEIVLISVLCSDSQGKPFAEKKHR